MANASEPVMKAADQRLRCVARLELLRDPWLKEWYVCASDPEHDYQLTKVEAAELPRILALFHQEPE